MSVTRTRSAWFLPDNAAFAAHRGTVGYDAACNFCTSMARRLAPGLASLGFDFAPLQSARMAAAAGLPPGRIPDEMMLLAPGGRVYSGAEAIAQIARTVWWAWPFWMATRVPAVAALARGAYRVVSSRRHCVGGACGIRPGPSRGCGGASGVAQESIHPPGSAGPSLPRNTISASADRS